MDEELSMIVDLLGVLVERLENTNAELRYLNEQLEQTRKRQEELSSQSRTPRGR